MSGSGGGGGDREREWRQAPTPVPKPKIGKGGGDGGENAPPTQCAIIENTTLNSPDRAVLATLRSGDLLDVEFQPGPPQRLIAKTAAGQIAGSITSPSMPQLIQCIQTGYQYVAQVQSVVGAICQVQIRPK